MITLNSSLRSAPPEFTLVQAKDFAARLGITRVTDITRLDRVGVPVFVGIRPSAIDGSYCVSAGKGLAPIEAQVGAFMEAIEFAVAQSDIANVQQVLATPRDLLDGSLRPEAVFDFCPFLGMEFSPDEPMSCLEAEDLLQGVPTLVPAELVLIPFSDQPNAGKFGAQCNGLASGNTIEDASLHALFELLEGDARSFNVVRDRASRICEDSLPSSVQEIIASVKSAELDIVVRALPSAFGVPVFEAVLWDPYAWTGFYLHGGWGCHLSREIALMRAVTEALQSRLSWLHGGRDRLEGQRARGLPLDEARNRFTACRGSTSTAFDGVKDLMGQMTTIDQATATTLDLLQRGGIERVCRVTLTDAHDPLHVVRMIVPRLEMFDMQSPRVGPRLAEVLAHAKS
jgi:ribosomal protein S12 methylthiotransferase accessory factor